MVKPGYIVALLVLAGFLAGVPVSSHVPPYRRAEWRHWLDVDRDCQNTRDEVLIAESLEPVTFVDARQCRVAGGRWRDPYSGLEYTSPNELDVDHVVPLGFAHAHGGWAWAPPIKAAYANDLEQPEHLLVVHRSLNRAKGSRGPDVWRPPEQEALCAYGRAWRDISTRWGLVLTWAEVDAITSLLFTCEG